MAHARPPRNAQPRPGSRRSRRGRRRHAVVFSAGLNFYALKLIVATIGLLGAFAATRLFVFAGVSRPALLGLLLAATPLYFDYSHRLMSEVPFVASSLVALTALLRLGMPCSRREQIVAGVTLVVAAALTVLIRGNGLALAPAIGVAMWFSGGTDVARRRWWMAAALAAVLTAFVGWTLWAGAHRFRGIHNVTYFQEVQVRDTAALWAAGDLEPGIERISPAEFARRLYENVAWSQIYHAGSLVWPQAASLKDVTTRRIGLLLALLALVPVAIGVTALARRSPPLLVFLAGSLLIALAYPTGGAARMLIPSIPLLLLASYLGLERVLGVSGATIWMTCALWAAIFTCAVQADLQAKSPYASPFFGGQSAPDAVSLIVEDVPRLTTRDDILISEYYQVIDALANRTALSPENVGAIPAERTVYAVEIDTQPIEPPQGYVKNLVSTRGAIRLVRWDR